MIFNLNGSNLHGDKSTSFTKNSDLIHQLCYCFIVISRLFTCYNNNYDDH